MNEFSQWNNYIEEVPPKQPEQPKFELNLLDLDFLDMLGGSGSKPSNSNNITPVVPESNKNYMSVPSGVAQKLQEGNNSFIVGYNSMSSAQTPFHSEPKRIESSPQI